jgi:hypothetical protein
MDPWPAGLSHLAATRQSTCASRFPRWQAAFRAGVCLPGPQALCFACFCGDAQSCASPPDRSSPLTSINEIAQGHHGQACQRNVGIDGNPFWQPESYDHVVRNDREFETIRQYIEENPVRAGLVRRGDEYRWSSAGRATRGSPADQVPCADQEVRSYACKSQVSPDSR